LTPPSSQSKTAFPVCFAARLVEVCLRPESGRFHPPNAASRILLATWCARLHRQLRFTWRPALLHRPSPEA
jgi:hypothetical protein